ncbi:hypothetical protein [Streptomyces sp. NPDC020983]|uniref:hypothetical protein n=1 Tax=Streptomyces sp. NPDC020983 TaxID=3365106 RepID=UPI00379F6A2D
MEIAQSAPELVGVVVRDGPMMEQGTDLRVLYIGWGGGTEDTDVETQVSENDLNGSPSQETTTIRCTAWAASGDTDVPSVRAQAYAMVSGLGAAIDRDRRLGGAVMRAMIGGHALTQQQTSRGAQAALTFEVTTSGFTGR